MESTVFAVIQPVAVSSYHAHCVHSGTHMLTAMGHLSLEEIAEAQSHVTAQETSHVPSSLGLCYKWALCLPSTAGPQNPSTTSEAAQAAG